EVQRQLAVQLPFVGYVPAAAVIDFREVELPHTDRKPVRIGRGICGVERCVSREREGPGEVRGGPLRQRAVPAVRCAELEGVLAGPTRLDPVQRGINGAVPNEILRGGGKRPGNVIRVAFLRADVERIDARESDKLPVAV